MTGIVRKLMREYLRVGQLDEPMISFVVPAFNEAEYIGATLDSIANQKYPRSEIIVVDNGSTDKTPEIAKKYTSHVYRMRDKGISKARNYGKKKATGDIVVFCDADTILEEGITNRIVDSINRGYSCGTFKLAPDEDIEEANRFYGGMNSWNRMLTPVANIFGKDLKTGSGAVMYFRRDDLEEIENAYGYAFDEGLGVKEDIDLLGRMQKNGYWAEFINDKSVETSARRIKRDGKNALKKKVARDVIDILPRNSWVRKTGERILKYEDFREGLPEEKGMGMAYA